MIGYDNGLRHPILGGQHFDERVVLRDFVECSQVTIDRDESRIVAFELLDRMSAVLRQLPQQLLPDADLQ